jgi:hypothetical protein
MLCLICNHQEKELIRERSKIHLNISILIIYIVGYPKMQMDSIKRQWSTKASLDKAQAS